MIGGVAGSQPLDLADGVDLGHGVVVGAEVAERRDVLLGAVGEGRLDDELAGLAGPGRRRTRAELTATDLTAPLPFGPGAPAAIHSRKS